MNALARRVRDRHFVRVAVSQVYTAEIRTASWAPEPWLVQALMEGFWESREGSTDREAFGGIMKAVGKLLKLVKRAPRAWDAIKRGLGLDEMEGLSLLDKAKVLGKRIRELATAGKKAIGKALKKITSTFPLSIFFVAKHKAPGLTDLITRILKKSPRLQALLSKVKGGAERVDKFFKKYIPRMSKALYAAIFVWVWFQVSEISWDIEGIIRGFTGQISFGELLASLPESGVGLIAASFGLGYGALPYVIIARIIWLVVNHFVTWVPGKGLRVHWSAMDVPENDELVAT